MDIVKNPIIIGVIAGVIAYVYLSWDIEEKNKKNKKRGRKLEEVNLLIPLVVAVLGWFIAYAYLQYGDEKMYMGNASINPLQPDRRGIPIPIGRQLPGRFSGDVFTGSSDVHSFALMTGGVTVPSKLPDVMLDLN